MANDCSVGLQCKNNIMGFYFENRTKTIAIGKTKRFDRFRADLASCGVRNGTISRVSE